MKRRHINRKRIIIYLLLLIAGFSLSTSKIYNVFFVLEKDYMGLASILLITVYFAGKLIVEYKKKAY
jgi:uncharacterized membrane protein YbjE (DUF340 family)